MKRTVQKYRWLEILVSLVVLMMIPAIGLGGRIAKPSTLRIFYSGMLNGAEECGG